MEREVGEVFEYEGEKLMVVENDGSDCKKCFFYNRDCSLIKDVRGFCSEEFRTDKKCVIFVKSNKEHPQEERQPQEEKPQELNLCEILKYCPEGWEFYHAVYGRVWFCCIDLYFSYPIRLSLSKEISDNTGVTSKGTINKDYNGECLLFPSKDQRDWSKFTAPWHKNEQKYADKIEPRFKVGDWVANKFGDSWHIDSLDKKNYQVSDGKGNYIYFLISEQDEMHFWTIQDAKDGDVLSFYSEYKSNKMVQVGMIEKYVGKHGGCSNTFKMYVGVNWDNNLQMGEYMGCSDIHPATKEQRDFLFQKIKESGYKWNAETKTLEKLVKPKFKVGDRVKHKDTNKDDVYEISKVYDGSYGIAGFNWMIYMKYQDQYELVSNKFDPKTLKPFDKVIVRLDNMCQWRCDLFSNAYKYNGAINYLCTSGNCYKQCIPYNDDTKHLVGTIDEAPDFYRYWED